MNAARSASSSCAISSSILAQIGTALRRRAGEELFDPGELDRVLRVREIRLVEVQDDQQRLGGQELETAQPLRVVRSELERAQRRARFERFAAALQDLLFLAQLRRVGLS